MDNNNEHLEHFILERLRNAQDLSSQRIEVIANGGTITLRGQVQSARRKIDAEETALRHPDVTEVVNELTIEEGTLVDDVAIANEVNVLLKNDRRVHGQTVRVDCLNGIVTLSGYVSTEDEKNIVGDIAIGVSGVRAINNMLLPNPDRVLSNLEHANRICGEIEGTIGLELDDFCISIVDETARISGTADEIWKKEEVEKIVRKHKILTLSNEIVVQPKPTS